MSELDNSKKQLSSQQDLFDSYPQPESEKRSLSDHDSVESTSSSDPVVEKFWRLTETRGNDGCWLWLGPRTGSKGYGALCFRSRFVYAHRYSYELHHGSVPAGAVILHTCDNPRCVNPEHLKAGTQQENIQDAVAKGRWMTEKRKAHLAELHKNPHIPERLPAPTGGWCLHWSSC